MRALLTILATIALAAAVWLWFSDGMTPVVPPTVEAQSALASPTAKVAAPVVPLPEAAAWERVQRSLDEITDRLAAIEARLDAKPVAAAPVEASTVRVDAVPAAFVDPQQLRRALDEIDAQRRREKYESMSDQELLAEVGRLQWKSNDVDGADAALQQLLARDLDPQERAQALTQLGMLQRQRHDLDGAEHTLRAVVDEHGMRDKTGAWAGYQLAWTLAERNPVAALGVADALAQQADSDGMRTRARWTAARMAEMSGDAVRARADYQAILAVVGDDKEFADVAKDIRYRLEQLGGN